MTKTEAAEDNRKCRLLACRDIADFPELTEEDIRAALAYAADRERRIVTAVA